MIHTKIEIAEFRREYAKCLRNYKKENGEPLLDDETITAYAFNVSDESLDDMMQYHTPESFAELNTW